jgi:hypothetical protein
MARQYGRSPPEHVPIDWLTPGESLLLFKDSFPVHDLAAQTLRKIEEAFAWARAFCLRLCI